MVTKAFSIEDTNLGNVSLTTRGTRDYSDIDLTFTTKTGPGGTTQKGDVYKKQSVEAVKQAVKTLLLTAPHEKPFRPTFGAGLEALLFDLNNGETDTLVRKKIEAAIKTFEPRARIEDLKVISQIDHNSIRIELLFSVINLQETFTFTTTVNRLR